MDPWCLLAWKIVEKALLDWHRLNGRHKNSSESRDEWPRDDLYGTGQRKQELRLFFHGEWFDLLCEAMPGHPQSAYIRRRHLIP